MSKVPEVHIVAPSFGDCGFLVDCWDLKCGFNDVVNTKEEAEELKTQHEEWHEDGMPE
ncbi:hypothetical protein GCM10018783_73960 [Streptomyces griseosporeus]|nr:hypothetical protein GCM10018783_73960 [Streptomyces griseosporeus]